MRLLYVAALLLLPLTAARPGDSPPVAPGSYKSPPVEAPKSPPPQPYGSPPPPQPYRPPAPAHNITNATCTNRKMNATNSANNYTTPLPQCSNSTNTTLPTPPSRPANNTNVTIPSPSPYGRNSTNTTSPPPPPHPPVMTYGPNATNATNTTLPSPLPHGLNATNMTTPSPPRPSPPYLTYGYNTTNLTKTRIPAPPPYGPNMTNMTAPPGPYGGSMTNSTNTTLPSPPIGGNMTNTTTPNITIPIPPYKMNTTTNLTYCVPEAATTIEQATLFSEFVDLIWKEADMKMALMKYVSKGLIKHDCDDTVLAPPGKTVVERIAFDGGTGWVHSMSSDVAYVDIYRFEGTCIVEHWDLAQKITNCTKSYALL
ncbi:hypothetical protein AC578_11063 [Pseudocercospora eumusae]|uniref:SnoaL-like domain-containing protein n=1 Tax=Pseudocercospora eumusae TaxID=321146 RepID=A0A139HSD8_9PEZI|nr:hypothetical protein AC578_11063 [Pseudocercospora eumusae]